MTTFPTPLAAFPPPSADGLVATLRDRVAQDPFSGVATTIFALAVLHSFAVAQLAEFARRVQDRHDAAVARRGLPPSPSVVAELFHFLGEVEVVFGLWAIALTAAIVWFFDWPTATHYFNDTVNYTEPLFVVVIMAMAATRPIILFAERLLREVAKLGRGTPAAWWATIVTIGPLLGSAITEPGAMTISALLLARQFYDLEPSVRLKYATLGLLFVNVSVGGTLTHFAAPPVLMVARVWGWDTPFMLGHFGWRAVVAIVASTLTYWFVFRGEMHQLAARVSPPDVDRPDEAASPTLIMKPVPPWITAVHVAFMAWTVWNSHYPVIVIAGFLFFLGFLKATAPFQSQLELRSPLLVGFFLAGLVIHGGLQGWWIAPTLAHLSERGLFLGAIGLTAVNDNALITYLATLVPNFSDGLKAAVVEGAVTGGGLTIIANAPNPAGQALLVQFFGGAVSPLRLLAAALIPTLIAAVAFRLL
jgi:Putative Na+/H+ antiporter